jgi:hypothetical protein
MQWPFKTIKKTSSWPMQPLVVQFAASVLHAPPEVRTEAAAKMIERCVRMGARLAVEFGMDSDAFTALAAEQIARETGAAGAGPTIFGAGSGEVPEA